MGQHTMIRFEQLGFLGIASCPRCRGEGWLFDDQECGTCSGTGEIAFDCYWLKTLAHNLATAAALCRAFMDGCTQGIAGLFDEIETLKTPSVAKCRPWVPGSGREAPR